MCRSMIEKKKMGQKKTKKEQPDGMEFFMLSFSLKKKVLYNTFNYIYFQQNKSSRQVCVITTILFFLHEHCVHTFFEVSLMEKPKKTTKKRRKGYSHTVLLENFIQMLTYFAEHKRNTTQEVCGRRAGAARSCAYT